MLWVKPAGQVGLSNVKGYIILMELAGMDCPMMELAGKFLTKDRLMMELAG